MLFHGELQLTDDPESRLGVALTLDGRLVSLATGDEDLGQWEQPAAAVHERSRGVYDLTLGDETLVFRPDNNSLFSSRGIPFFSAVPEPDATAGGFLSRIKGKLGNRPESPPAAPAPSRIVTLPSTALGPLEVADQVEPTIQPATSPSPTSTLAPPTPDVDRPLPEWTDTVELERGVSTPLDAATTSQSGQVGDPDPFDPAANVPVTEPIVFQDTDEDPVDEPAEVEPAREPRFIVIPQEQATDPDPEPEPEPRFIQNDAVHAVADDPDPSQADHSSVPLPDLPGLLNRLEGAVVDLQEGRMEPARGRAIADVVRAMCRAVEVSDLRANDLSALADTLDTAGLGAEREVEE